MVRPFISLRSKGRFAWSVAALVALVATASAGSSFATGTVRGRITGQDKLLPEVYAEAAKPDAHRYTWREPSPTVRPEFRALSATPSRDVCIAATINGTASPMQPLLVRVTGGRTEKSTYVVSPGTKLVFENRDPFPHRLVQKEWKAEINAGAQREWQAPGAGRYEFRDELFPSVRTYVVVEPTVVATIYPGRDGAFAMGLPPGEYVFKAFFQGNQVGKQLSLLVRDKVPTDVKEPLNLAEGGAGK